jgi:hypothetical protein
MNQVPSAEAAAAMAALESQHAGSLTSLATLGADQGQLYQPPASVAIDVVALEQERIKHE